MKKCTYCGRENPDEAVNCSGCAQDEFESEGSSPARASAGSQDLVLLMTCPRLVDTELIASKLEAAGIEAFVPDEELHEAGLEITGDGSVPIRVNWRDYDQAKALVSALEAASAGASQSSEPGGKRVIASMEASQLSEISERLKKADVPFEVRTTTQESGLELGEILVEDAYFDRGCDVVEALAAEKEAEAQKRSGVFCDQCGSRDYAQIPHDKLGFVYKCKVCGNEFVR